MFSGARLTSYSYDAFTGAAKVNLGQIYSHAASVAGRCRSLGIAGVGTAPPLAAEIDNGSGPVSNRYALALCGGRPVVASSVL